MAHVSLILALLIINGGAVAVLAMLSSYSGAPVWLFVLASLVGIFDAGAMVFVLERIYSTEPAGQDEPQRVTGVLIAPPAESPSTALELHSSARDIWPVQ